MTKQISKTVFALIILGAFSLVVSPSLANAMTAEELMAKIVELQAQITVLQQELTRVQGQPAAWCHDFNVNLGIGSRGDEVQALEYALVKEGFSVTEHGSNFPAVFDERMASAVTGFQQKYASEILTPLGLKYGTGYVGKATRTKLNQLYGCATPMPTVSPSPTITPTPAPSITVLSPNGGETWTKGTTQTIKWQDNTPPCPLATCPSPALKYYDIKLVTYYSPCAGTICPKYPYLTPYTIANSVYGSLYSWSVGKILATYGSSDTAPDGSYTIQICQTGSATCDSSDSYFKIVSGAGANSFPFINRIPAVSSDIKTGQSVPFTWGATDADGDDLSWSVSWGDGNVTPGACASPNHPQNKENWTFTASHAWANPGTYTVKATVNDCRGGSDEHTLNVAVGSSVALSITVLSPNGGEKWQIGKTYDIRWNATGTGIDKKMVAIVLYGYDASGKIISSRFLGSNYLPATTGLLSWRISLDQLPGEKYKILVGADYVETVGFGGLTDESDNYFSIVSSTTASCNTLGTMMYTASDGTGFIGCDIKVSGDFVLAKSYCQGQTTGRKAYLTPDGYGRANQYYATLTGLKTTEEVKVFIASTDGREIECLPSLNKQTATPSLTVLSPNGGEVWEVGKTYNIRWISQTLPTGQLGINLLKDGIHIRTLFVPVVNDGIESWIVPDVVTSGSASGYKVQVRLLEIGTGRVLVSDDSDAPFIIVAPTISSITVLSPNGGEQWETGSTHAISWQSANVPAGATAGLALYKGGVYKPEYFRVYQLPPTTGTYNWAVPNTIPAGNDYKMEVEMYNSSGNLVVLDQSDAPFSIIAPSEKPAIVVVTPNGGEKWARAGIYDITWRSNNLPAGTLVDIYLVETSRTPEILRGQFLRIANDGIEKWTIPPLYDFRDDYVISIMAGCDSFGKNCLATDRSDMPFSIVAPGTSSIIVLSPNGGEQWETGSTHAISWQSANAPAGATVGLALYKGGAYKPEYLRVYQLPPTTGVYNWAVPNTIPAGNDYKMEVEMYNSSGNLVILDQSDGYFSIVAPSASGAANMLNIGNQLASISEAVSGLLKSVQEFVSAR